MVFTSVSIRCRRSGMPSGISMSRAGLRSIAACSAGRTIVPVSSIHTAMGTLTNPNSSSVTWVTSIRLGCVGAAASIQGRAFSGLTSSATDTTVRPAGSSSAYSACHPGRLARQPHQLAQATSSTLRPCSADSLKGLPSASMSSGSAAAADVRAWPPDSGPSAQRPWSASCTSGMRRRSAMSSTPSVPSSALTPRAGTQTSPLHRPSGLASQPVRSANADAPTRSDSRSTARPYPVAVRAWAVQAPGPIDTGPLALGERPVPEPGPGEVRLRVSVCGVCRTDLHLAEGDLTPRRPGVVPGHEVVGVVDAVGPGATRFRLGERTGVAWLRHTCGLCRFCLRGDENLCLAPRFTGWDDDGGYADYVVVEEAYAYRLPPSFDDEHVAPLLCAGIIGYRALRRALLPPGGRLGIYGFGGSAHITAQVALHEGATVHVLTRGAKARHLALELGCASAGDADATPPEPLDAAILFA